MGFVCIKRYKPASKHIKYSFSMKIKKGIFRLKWPGDHNRLCWEFAACREVKVQEGFADEILC